MTLKFPDQDKIESLIKTALAEDVGPGDHTTLATIPHDAQGKARLIIKQDGILAGVQAANAVFRLVDPDLHFSPELGDGTAVNSGDIAFTISGRDQSILMAERLCLNIMQRMSGIATKTKKLTELISDLPCKLLDTRKTTPGFRYFEKWAVKIGGGENHRFGLYDMILIKDNHVDYAGGISKALDAAQKYLVDQHLKIKIEIETRSLKEVREVLKHGGADRIMLDNFSPGQLTEAVELINGSSETEASGGITGETLREYALTGVDFISMGALTHRIKSLDMSLKAY